MGKRHGLSPLGGVLALAAVASGGEARGEDGDVGDGGEGGEPAERAAGEVIDIVAPRPLGVAPSARTVGRAELALTPRRHPDDLLKLAPGLHVGRHGAEGKGAEIFLRGFDAGHGSDLEVRAAGVPLNELSNIHGQGYLDLGFLIPEVIAEKRVRKGALGLEQGRFATAGSIELELGAPAIPGDYAPGYEIGSTNRHRGVAVAAPAGDGATFFAAEAMRDGGFGSGRAAARGTALGQARVDLPGGGAAEVFGAAYAARFGEGGPVPLEDVEDGRIGFYDTYGLGGPGASERAIAGARVRRPVGDGRVVVGAHGQWRNLELDDNFTGFFEHPERGDRRGEDHAFWAGGARLRFAHPLSGPVELRAGAEILADRFEQTRDHLDTSGEPWGHEVDAAGAHIASSAHLGAVVATSRVRAEAGGRVDGLWIRARDRLDDRPTAIGGAGEGGLTGAALTLSPRAAIAARPAAAWTISAGYGHGARPPAAGAVLAGAAELSWVRSRGADLGARYRPTRWLGLEASAFGIWIPRELIFDHVTGEQIDEGATRRLGGEVAATVQPAPWLDLRADFTAVSARFSAGGESVPGPPRALGSAEARLSHASGLRGGARLTALGARPLGGGARADPDARLDLLLGYRFRGADIALEIENLTGARHAAGAYYYPSRFDVDEPRSDLPRPHYTAGPPRLARLSLRYAF